MAVVALRDFRTVADLARVISHNLWRLPSGIAGVVAVPESGRLPAVLVGLQIDRPVIDLEALLAPESEAPGAVLLVDDVAMTGATMRAARDRLAARHPGLAVHRLAVFCHPDAEAAADLVFAVAPPEPIFEWSLFRSPVLERACFDLDGILCGDCPNEDDDDGPRYRRFLECATPQIVPRGRLRAIVTARLEKFRPETEAWLGRYGIEYERLVMLDLASEAERRRTRPQASFKAATYVDDPQAVLFIESESWQAREIARAAGGKSVYDYQMRVMLNCATLAERSLQVRLQRRLAGIGRRVVGRLARAAS